MKPGRKKRLKEARIWYPKHAFTSGAHILHTYRNKFNVDKLCAMRELVLLGLLPPEIQQSFEDELAARDRKIEMERENKRRRKAAKSETSIDEDPDQDAYFYFIAGYTDGGAPYGITWEEARRKGYLDETDEPGELEETGQMEFPDDELPF